MLAPVFDSPCARLTAAVDELAGVPIDASSTDALGEDLVAIRREIDRLEAQFVRRAHRFDAAHGAVADGSPSTVSWMRDRCGLPSSAAAERVRMARMLEGLPQTAESFRAGRAPFGNVSLIARLADDVGVEATRRVEETLVGAAEKVDPGQMRYLAMFTRHCIDADGVLSRDNRNYERRWFACDQGFDGSFVVRGQLDAEGGALVKAAVDAASLRRGPADERTGSQRRADALVDMASGLLRSGTLPSIHGERPHLVVTTSLEALQGHSGALPPEIQGVGPVHPETARRIACDASLRVAVEHGGDGEREDRSYSIGRASRTVPAAMRTAMALRDKGCRYPGCDRPLEWTDAHHIDHWTADSGPTKVPNLLSLCRFHHRVVHEQGREIRLKPDGTVEVSERGARDPTPFHRRE